ncbi:MAG: HEAT repeat domain-containing protein [Actinomycetota bacterium]|nr:HEAT repeat domain-containing protein [Actinomycetota bacterium]
MPRSLPRRPASSDALRAAAADAGDPGDETRRTPVLERRAAAAMAGHLGDETAARAALEDPAPSVRIAGYSSLVRLGAARAEDGARASADLDPDVRRAVCELAPHLPGADYRRLLEDDDPAITEAAAYALGEVRDASAVQALAAIAASHDEPLCRESAVAALGAIGDGAGKAAVLAALEDVATVRRRAVVALAAFEGPDVDAALERCLADRDWQVRQAAEDLSG